MNAGRQTSNNYNYIELQLLRPSSIHSLPLEYAGRNNDNVEVYEGHCNPSAGSSNSDC